MPDDVTDDLKRFTPAGLDRDAVLFAAGRASALRRPFWKWLAAGLAASNAVTLAVLLWPQPSVNPSVPVVEPDIVSPEPYRPEPSSYIALTWGLEAPPAAEAGGTPAPPAPPLTPRAFDDLRIR